MKDRDLKRPTPSEGEQIEEQLGDAEGAEAEQTEAGEASIAEWQAALETAVKQRDEYLAMAQRVQADFQNFKRRNAQSRTDGFQDGVCEALTALLPALDNIDRAIRAADEAGEESALAEGVKMTHRLLMEEAGKLGLEEVPALHERFDPELHNAVMRAEEGEPGTVLEVFQKGYRVKDRIIRYAMVKVAAE